MRYALDSDGSEFSAFEQNNQVSSNDTEFQSTNSDDDIFHWGDEDESETGSDYFEDENANEDPVDVAARQRVPVRLNTTDDSETYPIPSGLAPIIHKIDGRGRPKVKNKRYKLSNIDKRFLIHARAKNPIRGVASIRFELCSEINKIKNTRAWPSLLTIQRFYKKWNSDECIFRDRRLKLSGSGPKEDYVVNDNFLDKLEKTIESTPMGFKTDLAKILECSISAVTKGLKKLGFRGYVIRKVQRLQPRHHEERLRYCHRMIELADRYKECTYDTDEFYMDSSKRHFWTRYLRYYARGREMVPAIAYEQASCAKNGPRIMVWCAVKYNTLLWYIWPKGSRINSQTYIEMLEKEFFGAGHFKEGDVLQQDGCSSHVSKATMAYLATKTDNLISKNNNKWGSVSNFPEYPACSPDHAVCDFGIFPAVKRDIFKILPINCSYEQAVDCVTEVLTKYSQDKAFINACIDGKTKRYQECIDRNGGLFEPWRKKNKKKKNQA